MSGQLAILVYMSESFGLFWHTWAACERLLLFFLPTASLIMEPAALQELPLCVVSKIVNQLPPSDQRALRASGIVLQQACDAVLAQSRVSSTDPQLLARLLPKLKALKGLTLTAAPG